MFVYLLLQALVPIANGTEPVEAAMIIGVLRRAETVVTVASIDKQLRIDACHGVKIIAEALLSDCVNTTYDLIVLPVCFFPSHGQYVPSYWKCLICYVEELTLRREQF